MPVEKVKPSRHREEDVPPPISTVDPKIVLDNVFKQLGKPSNLTDISPCLTRATPITQTAFRVQVYVRGDESRGIGAAPSLAHSFWVKVNGLGDIVSSDPAIEKTY